MARPRRARARAMAQRERRPRRRAAGPAACACAEAAESKPAIVRREAQRERRRAVGWSPSASSASTAFAVAARVGEALEDEHHRGVARGAPVGAERSARRAGAPARATGPPRRRGRRRSHRRGARAPPSSSATSAGGLLGGDGERRAREVELAADPVGEDVRHASRPHRGLADGASRALQPFRSQRRPRPRRAAPLASASARHARDLGVAAACPTSTVVRSRGSASSCEASRAASSTSVCCASASSRSLGGNRKRGPSSATVARGRAARAAPSAVEERAGEVVHALAVSHARADCRRWRSARARAPAGAGAGTCRRGLRPRPRLDDQVRVVAAEAEGADAARAARRPARQGSPACSRRKRVPRERVDAAPRRGASAGARRCSIAPSTLISAGRARRGDRGGRGST